ncbi:MAG: O-antigen ligase family protein [Candidatus Melainabacteria bacterium]|nr:O-antigen ligase family protein [Candidatus Melainabacteria bacterium]
MLIIIIFSTALRFSIEHFLIISSLIGFSLSPWWQNKAKKERRNLVLIFFLLLYIFDLRQLALSEQGALILWFPVFLALYYNQKNISGYASRALAGIALIFSKKTTVILAYLSTLVSFFKTQYLILIATIILALSFASINRVIHFLEISLLPRLHIWQSCLHGWLAKPFFGHGFGVFAISFAPYRAHDDIHGAMVHQQVSHGHNLFTHFLFEQGLLGLALCVLIFYLVYKYARDALLPLLVISLFDAPLVTYNQYFLAALILMPEFKWEELKQSLTGPALKFSRIAIHIFATVLFSCSVMGHYHYYKGTLDKAIKWDPYHSLYHFTRGALTLNTRIDQSLIDLKRAVELSPNVAFYYGFLAGAQLANKQSSAADKTIDRAIALDGEEIYWITIKAFANYSDQKTFDHYFSRAIKAKPELVEIIQKPNYSSDAAISSQGGDARVTAFYRHGPSIPLPLPYFAKGMPERVINLIDSVKINRD